MFNVCSGYSFCGFCVHWHCQVIPTEKCGDYSTKAHQDFDLNQSPYISFFYRTYFTSCGLQFGVRLKMAMPMLSERTEVELNWLWRLYISLTSYLAVPTSRFSKRYTCRVETAVNYEVGFMKRKL